MTRKEYARHIRHNTRENKHDKKCSICNSTDNIQQHHIATVYDLSKIASKNELTEKQVKKMYCETEDLCDYHHKIIHYLLGTNDFSHDKLSIEEFDNYMIMFRKMDISQVQGSLANDYEELEHHMFNYLIPAMLNDCDFTLEELEELEEILNDYPSIEESEEEEL